MPRQSRKQGVAADLEFVYAYPSAASVILWGCSRRAQAAHIAQSAEHILGKDGYPLVAQRTSRGRHFFK